MSVALWLTTIGLTALSQNFSFTSKEILDFIISIINILILILCSRTAQSQNFTFLFSYLFKTYLPIFVCPFMLIRVFTSLKIYRPMLKFTGHWCSSYILDNSTADKYRVVTYIGYFLFPLDTCYLSGFSIGISQEIYVM